MGDCFQRLISHTSRQRHSAAGASCRLNPIREMDRPRSQNGSRNGSGSRIGVGSGSRLGVGSASRMSRGYTEAASRVAVADTMSRGYHEADKGNLQDPYAAIASAMQAVDRVGFHDSASRGSASRAPQPAAGISTPSWASNGMNQQRLQQEQEAERRFQYSQQQALAHQVVLEASKATIAVEQNQYEEYAEHQNQLVLHELEELKIKFHTQYEEYAEHQNQLVLHELAELKIKFHTQALELLDEQEAHEESERQVHNLKGELAEQRDTCELLTEKLAINSELEGELQQAKEGFISATNLQSEAAEKFELLSQLHQNQQVEIDGLRQISETQERLLEETATDSDTEGDLQSKLDTCEHKLHLALAATTRAETDNEDLKNEFQNASTLLSELMEKMRSSEDALESEKAQSGKLVKQVSQLEHEVCTLKNELKAEARVEQSLADSCQRMAEMRSALQSEISSPSPADDPAFGLRELPTAAGNILKTMCDVATGGICCRQCASELAQFPVPTDGQFACDMCDRIFTPLNATSLMSCRDCDFDVCNGCFKEVPSAEATQGAISTPRWMERALGEVKGSRRP